MEPQLNNFCTIYVKCCSASELSRGDIITFLSNNEIACHRFIFRRGDYLFERGDNCSLWSKLNRIQSELIIGKVVAYKNDGCELHYTEHFSFYASVLWFIGVLSHVFAYKMTHEDRELTEGGLVSKLIKRMMCRLLHFSERRHSNVFINGD